MPDMLCGPRIFLVSERNYTLLQYLISLRKANNAVPLDDSEILEAALFSSLCNYIRDYDPSFCGSIPVSMES